MLLSLHVFAFEGQNMKFTINMFAYLHSNSLGQTRGCDEYNTNMFSDIEAKTSPRLPSWFEAMYKFCVDIRPNFPVPYLTLKEQLHIRQQSFARFTFFFTAFFGVSAPSMKKFDHPPRKSPRAMRCHVCLYFASLLLDSYLTNVKCRLVPSRRAELKKK